MHANRREFLAGLLAPALAAHAQSRALHTFTTQADQFLLDGKPFVIRSGDMHYPRVPRAYWRDRMRKMRALGLNTLCTYVFWNLHEPEPGKFDFSGNLDLAEYLRAAQSEGLWVLLRPGPYICSEWDFGGFPAWLLADADMAVRTTYPGFLRPASRYLARVGKEVAGLQITRGGPILMAQVENEYGSFGSDRAYMDAIRQMLRDSGFDITLYTSDGSLSTALAGGTLDDCLAAIYFGDTSNPERQFANFANFRQNVPRMCGEYWVGWFDSWGAKHHTTDPKRSVAGLEWMLSRGISSNLYMVHGGSSFGYMSGANLSRFYEPEISAYDYDSPLDEAGRPTAKFHALRDVIRKHLPEGESLPDLPAPLPMAAIPRFELRASAALLAGLSNPHRSKQPVPMEALGQSYGFIVYRKHLDRPVKGTLEILELRDYGLVIQGDRVLGALDRRLQQNKLDVELDADQPLDILVENMGRVDFGPGMLKDRKGITEKVTVNGEELTGWEIYPLPLTEPDKLTYSTKPSSGPALHRGTFHADTIGDSFLDMRGWGKGIAWINGHNLGRYWKIGPQQSLFLPGAWLKKGANEAIVLDLEDGEGVRELQSRLDPVYETPKSGANSG